MRRDAHHEERQRVDPSAPAVSDRDWRSLATLLSDGGRLLRPGDRGYALTRPVSNRRYASVLPGAVAACRGPKDIAAAVDWAGRREMPFALRSGGHSYAGYSATTGLLIDLSGLDTITVDEDAGEVTVGTGVTQDRLQRALAPYGRTFPAGRCPTVAMGGLILGGGIGFSCRRWGLACDALVRTDVLTAGDGVVTCSADSHADLFWACRGGAGGSLGVNTAFTLRTEPTGRVTLFDIEWPVHEARPVLAAVQELAARAPGELGVRIDVATSGSCPQEAAARASVSAIGQYHGPRAELERLLAPVLEPAARPRIRIRECEHREAFESFAEMPPVNRFAVKSRMVRDALPAEAVDVVVEEIRRWPGSRDEDGASAALFALGGAAGRIPAAATAFVHRDAAFVLALETNWTDDDPPEAARAGLDWLERLHERLRPYTADGAYQNFPDPELENWRAAYYGSNYDRLVGVKRAYDPDDVFRFAQSIGS
ncbi:putative FAD-linked oxidoreductase YvdP [Streptomyces sp. RB5]|uniref:Putative FAD-linked oxidoreductase YvdP n=1 Tax=Streptomyces smaragdinus TaxID=2585196 RepID=A0A7K0CG81_9ACTN|nr:FAD-binding oxidoreductase [Streptomyces smaragdinus]MQY12477.1 putative FAD-linked oxidoreductase YvdP [Streptomyces smaragdinus]